ncbi:hypothetical protein AVEN_5098-1 [Araneus ventricosus]|uniref:Uncharacterized protein n=1 Tax=Araneus ventricosus TaxID=182803 RepID=A0A4Y2MI58_ARAVE|nr:hypothetical protein AVEN_5098-1 [Araneus ventricosus]
MMLYNFAIHFCPLSRTVLEIITLTPSFSTRWHCKWFHPVAHSHFTMPRHHSYEDSCSRSVVKRVVRDFSGHPVYELVEEHNQDLSTEELTELFCVSQQEVVEESSSEEEEEVTAKQHASSAI